MAAESKIIIKDNVIVGRYSHLIGRDHRFDIVGHGCVIGAGSIVTKDIPPYTIYTNKGLRPRFTEEQIKEHEKLLYKNSNS